MSQLTNGFPYEAIYLKTEGLWAPKTEIQILKSIFGLISDIKSRFCFVSNRFPLYTVVSRKLISIIFRRTNSLFFNSTIQFRFSYTYLSSPPPLNFLGGCYRKFGLHYTHILFYIHKGLINRFSYYLEILQISFVMHAFPKSIPTMYRSAFSELGIIEKSWNNKTPKS